MVNVLLHRCCAAQVNSSRKIRPLWLCKTVYLHAQSEYLGTSSIVCWYVLAKLSPRRHCSPNAKKSHQNCQVSPVEINIMNLTVCLALTVLPFALQAFQRWLCLFKQHVIFLAWLVCWFFCRLVRWFFFHLVFYMRLCICLQNLLGVLQYLGLAAFF